MQKLFSLSLILVVSPVTGREGRSTKVPGKPLGVPKEAGPFLICSNPCATSFSRRRFKPRSTGIGMSTAQIKRAAPESELILKK